MTARDDWPNVVDLTTPPGVSLGRRDAINEMFDEIDRLRAEVDAWMNGVADAVEPLGFDRGSACGPSDLLPGLAWLTGRDNTNSPVTQ